jgi:hypothetical protein
LLTLHKNIDLTISNENYSYEKYLIKAEDFWVYWFHGDEEYCFIAEIAELL